MGQKKALVVEDEVLIRMLAVDMLLELGYEAEEAGSAGEAIEKLKAAGADYALVFLDVGLPDRRGEELIQEIRGFAKALPLLVASGEDPAGLKAKLGKFQPIVFLGKPYDMVRLKESLASLTG